MFSEEEVILLGTAGQQSEFWEGCAASLQVTVNRVLQRSCCNSGQAIFSKGRRGFCGDGHICNELARYRKSGSGGSSQESWWLPSAGL